MYKKRRFNSNGFLMSPLGKFVLAVIGLRLCGVNGFFWGMLIGHLFVDRTRLIKKIESAMMQLDDNIRLMLPYNVSRYYNRIDGNFWGKLLGGILGAVLYGGYGFIVLFILGHFLFDTPKSSHANRFRTSFDNIFVTNIGKIIGGVVGFSLESNLLIFVGVIIGFFYDKRKSLNFLFKLPKWAVPVFFFGGDVYLKAVAGLAAKISKADGVVSVNEIKLFKDIFGIGETDNSIISKIFNKAKEKVEGFEPFARELGKICVGDVAKQEKIVESMFKIALVDGKISDFERDMLHKIAELVGLPEGNFKVIEDRFEPKPQEQATVCDFYEILGVMRGASDSEIKKRWRQLINEYHPDKVQANGGSAEEVEASTQKMAEINAAYEAVLKSRKVA